MSKFGQVSDAHSAASTALDNMQLIISTVTLTGGKVHTGVTRVSTQALISACASQQTT